MQQAAQRTDMIIKISDDARYEIESITEYLATNFGLRIAREKLAKLYSDIDYLIDNPFMGRSVDGHDKNLRILSSKPNVIIYDVNDRTVEILHIVDSRTDYIRTLNLDK